MTQLSKRHNFPFYLKAPMLMFRDGFAEGEVDDAYPYPACLPRHWRWSSEGTDLILFRVAQDIYRHIIQSG